MIGFRPTYDTVEVTATAGRIRVYQLRPEGFCLTETISDATAGQ
jgi:hypothetical protein